MTNYQTQLSSYESADYSLGRKDRRERSREQLSVEAFLRSRASSNFITRFSDRVVNMSHVFTGILFALFILVLLVAIVVGTNVYRSLYQEGQNISDTRIATSLLYNTIRSVDSEDALEAREGPEGIALILNERAISGAYETRIYLYEGELVQEYTHVGAPFSPEDATGLVKTDTFDFLYRDGLLTITTSEGQTDIALRCASGGN